MKPFNDLKIYANRNAYGNGVTLFGFSGVAQRSHAQLLAMEEHDEGAYVEPFATITDDAAQELMDSLWRAGIRPSSGEGSVGQIGALRDHKEDLRALVFEHLLPHLNLEKPE